MAGVTDYDRPMWFDYDGIINMLCFANVQEKIHISYDKMRRMKMIIMMMMRRRQGFESSSRHDIISLTLVSHCATTTTDTSVI